MTAKDQLFKGFTVVHRTIFTASKGRIGGTPWACRSSC